MSWSARAIILSALYFTPLNKIFNFLFFFLFSTNFKTKKHKYNFCVLFGFSQTLVSREYLRVGDTGLAKEEPLEHHVRVHSGPHTVAVGGADGAAGAVLAAAGLPGRAGELQAHLLLLSLGFILS